MFEAENTDQLAAYATYMSRDRYHRQMRSAYKAWQAHLFGKDWFYRIFLAFGTISQEIIDCVNTICASRAIEHFEGPVDLASSQVEFARLSERSKAGLLGQELPPVRGINHVRSVPYQARDHARQQQREYYEWEAKQWQDYQNSPASSRGSWTAAEQQEWERRWQAVQDNWDYAERISYESGFEFYDRHGEKRGGKKNVCC